MKIAELSRVVALSYEVSSTLLGKKRVGGWKEFARAGACISMAAQLACSPLVAAGRFRRRTSRQRKIPSPSRQPPARPTRS